MAEGDVRSGRRPCQLALNLIAFAPSATAPTTATPAVTPPAPTATTTATTAVTATATTAAAAEVATRAAVTATAAAGRTIFLGTRNIHRQRATVQLGAVHGGNRLLGLFGRGVGDEGKPA